MSCRTINGKPTLNGDYEHDLEQCRCRINADTALLEKLQGALKHTVYCRKRKCLACMEAFGVLAGLNERLMVTAPGEGAVRASSSLGRRRRWPG